MYKMLRSQTPVNLSFKYNPSTFKINNMKRKCKIDECENKHRSKGFCSKHYQRFRRYRNPLYVIPTRICSLKSCNKKHRCKNLCEIHYQRFRKHGNPLHIRERFCSLEECNEIHEAKNFCKKHYKQYNRKLNRKHYKNYDRNYHKKHPEIGLRSNKKRLIKLGEQFNMNHFEYQYALNSWSKTIKKLDNYMCKNCDSIHNLNAHHIMPKKDFPELSLNLENGITLCEYCHSLTHGFEIYPANIVKQHT